MAAVDLGFITPEMAFFGFVVVGLLILGLWVQRANRTNRAVYRNQVKLSRAYKSLSKRLDEIANHLVTEIPEYGNREEQRVEGQIEKEVQAIRSGSNPGREPGDILTNRLTRMATEGPLKGNLKIVREEPTDLGSGWHIDPFTFEVELDRKEPKKKSLLDELVPE